MHLEPRTVKSRAKAERWRRREAAKVGLERFIRCNHNTYLREIGEPTMPMLF